MYEILSFRPCDSPDREAGYDKIALYAMDDVPTHAARLWKEDEFLEELSAGLSPVIHSSAQYQYPPLTKRSLKISGNTSGPFAMTL